MSELTCPILLAFVVLSVKHTIGDYFLQTSYQYVNKGIYGHPGGLLHSGIHVALTIPVFLLLPPSSLLVAVGLLVGEFIVHYHLDWSKEQLVKKHDLTQTNPWFWHVFGLDQLGHLLTYVVIIAVLISS